MAICISINYFLKVLGANFKLWFMLTKERTDLSKLIIQASGVGAVLLIVMQNTLWKKKKLLHRYTIPPKAVLYPASFLLAMAHSCWLKTQDGTVGPSRLVLDYFVSHTAIIKTHRHNLFTARRLSVGSSHLSPWNNCCDDRLCWEHVQACENMHHFRLEGLESQPSWCDRKSDISLFRSSNQFLLCALWCSMSKDSVLFLTLI